MNSWSWAYDRLVGDGGDVASASRWLRRRRWESLITAFPDLDQMNVIDLGGTLASWRLAPVQPAHLTLVNLSPVGEDLPPWVDEVIGDACEIAEELAGRGFDLAYSNSVIEHVGGHARRCSFAQTIQQLAPAHWVQTPYRYFPIEPHWLFPGFQFLPVKMRAAAAMKWPLYKWRSDDSNRALREVLEIELLSKTELKFYFPDSEIIAERVMGLTKSYVAVYPSST